MPNEQIELTVSEANPDGYQTVRSKDKYLGFFNKGDDGYYVFWSAYNGYWTESLLEAIASKIRNMNFEWDNKVRAASIIKAPEYDHEDFPTMDHTFW